MKVLLGISLSKKNYKFLPRFINSLNNLQNKNGYNIVFIFILEKKNFYFNEIILRNFSNKNFKLLYVKKSGIPHSRNKFLNYIRFSQSTYAGFLDDDCTIPRDWLMNMLNFKSFHTCNLVGAPQLHKAKDKFYDKLYKLIEPHRKHGENIDWAATNNVFFESKIIRNNNHYFDEKLKNIGGSDQLFFKKLKKDFKLIYKWNLKSPVYENIQIERESVKWFINRNFRYGFSGSYIDKIIYGNFCGITINILKFFYLLVISIFYIFLFINNKYFIESIFSLSKAWGRLLGLTNYKPKKYI